jgi:phospholipid/cholesterol/gamma-HCH transport system substrate-binding protein
VKLRNGRISRTLERVATEPGLKRNVITLVALIALASVSGGIILGHQRVSWPWHHDFVVYAAFQDVPGVSADHGQEVRIAGVRVGDIESASVDADGHAEVKLSLSPNYKIYSNATVVLRPKSPLNEMYIELSPGSPPAGKQLKSGGHLSITNSQRPIEVDEALDHLDANAQSALTTLLSESDAALANAGQELPAGVRATDLLTKQLAPVMTSLATRRATIQKLVTSLQEISTAVGGDDTRLTSLVTSLQKTLDAVGGGSNALDSTLGQLPDLSTQLKSATDAVQELSTQLNPALDNLRQASGALPPALRSLTNTIDQAGVTIGQLSPVIADAAPVVRSLRPLVSDLVSALPDLQSMVNHLDPVTSELVKYLPDLGAFVLNSRSMTSEMDANSGILRGLLEVTPSSVPAGLLPSLSGK